MDPSAPVTELSEAKRLQFLASLACCARCTGNKRLADKLFEHARRISQKFYDQTAEMESPIQFALGFALLGIYTESESLNRAARYVSPSVSRSFPLNRTLTKPSPSPQFLIAESIIQQSNTDDALKLPLKFFVQALRFACTPLPKSLSLSWSLNAGERAPPHVTQSMPLPSVFNFDNKTVNPFVPLTLNAGTAMFPPLPLEVVEMMPPILFLEAMAYIRGVLEYYSDLLVCLMAEQHMKEEYFHIEVGSLPEGVCLALTSRLAVIATKRGNGLTPFTGGLGNAVRALASYMGGNSDDALYSINEFVTVCYTPENQEMVLLSPSFHFAKACIITCFLLLHLGDLDLYDRVMALLSFYARIGYVSAISGTQVLESIKARLHPGAPPFSESSKAALDFTQKIGEAGIPYLNAFPQTSLPPQPSSHQASSDTNSASPSSFEEYSPPEDPPHLQELQGDEGSGSYVDLGDEQANAPMDVFFSLLEQGNEQKLLDELGFLFKSDQFSDLN